MPIDFSDLSPTAAAPKEARTPAGKLDFSDLTPGKAFAGQKKSTLDLSDLTPPKSIIAKITGGEYLHHVAEYLKKRMEPSTAGMYTRFLPPDKMQPKAAAAQKPPAAPKIQTALVPAATYKQPPKYKPEVLKAAAEQSAQVMPLIWPDLEKKYRAQYEENVRKGIAGNKITGEMQQKVAKLAESKWSEIRKELFRGVRGEVENQLKDDISNRGVSVAVENMRWNRTTKSILQGVYGNKGLDDLVKADKIMKNTMGKVNTAAIAITNPFAAFGYEASQQLLNVLVPLVKENKLKLNPMENRMLSELYPKNVPVSVRVGTDLVQTLGQVALVGALTRMSTTGLVKSQLRQMETKLKEAGYTAEDIKRWTGGDTTIKIDLKQYIKGTTLEREMRNWLKMNQARIVSKYPKLNNWANNFRGTPPPLEKPPLLPPGAVPGGGGAGMTVPAAPGAAGIPSVPPVAAGITPQSPLRPMSTPSLFDKPIPDTIEGLDREIDKFGNIDLPVEQIPTQLVQRMEQIYARKKELIDQAVLQGQKADALNAPEDHSFFISTLGDIGGIDKKKLIEDWGMLPEEVNRYPKEIFGKMAPDEVAQDLFENGVIPNPSMNELFRAMDAYKKWRGIEIERKQQAAVVQEKKGIYEPERGMEWIDLQNKGAIPGEPLYIFGSGEKPKATLFEAEGGRGINYSIQRDDGTFLLNPKTRNEYFKTIKEAQGEYKRQEITKETIKDIPVFKNSNEAISWGFDHAGDKELAAKLMELHGAEIAKPAGKGNFQEMMDRAVRAQFYREAAEAIEGKITLQEVEKLVGKLKTKGPGQVKETKEGYLTEDEMFRKILDYYESNSRKDLLVHVKKLLMSGDKNPVFAGKRWEWDDLKAYYDKVAGEPAKVSEKGEQLDLGAGPGKAKAPEYKPVPKGKYKSQIQNYIEHDTAYGGSVAVNSLKITSPNDVADIVYNISRNEGREKLWVLYEKKGALKALELNALGTIDQAVIYPRNLIEAAHLLGADAVWISHIHPSGNPEPSSHDIELTRKIQESLKTVGIKLKGHIIIDHLKYRYLDEQSIPSPEMKLEIKPKGERIPTITVKKKGTLSPESLVLKSPEQAAKYFAENTRPESDLVLTIYLNSANQVIANRAVQGMGNTAESLARTMIKTAFSCDASRVIIGQNDAIIEGEGLKTIKNMLGNVDMEILDAVTIKGDGFDSAREHGLLEKKAAYAEGGIAEGKEGYNPEERPHAKEPEPAAGEKPGEMPGKVTKKSEIADFLSEKFNVPVRRGKFRQRALGIYKTRPDIIRLKRGGLQTLFHEVGHYLSDNIAALNFHAWRRRTGYEKEFKEKGASYRTKELMALSARFGPSRNTLEEGFAEYLRIWVSDPDEARKVAPAFTDYFNRTMRSYPEALNVLNNTHDMYVAWQKMPAVAKVMGQISFDPKKQATTTYDQLYTKIVDDLHPIEEYTKLAKAKGIEILPDADPYVLARLYRGVVGKANHALEKGTFNRNLEITGKGLKEILAPASKEEDLRYLSAYLASKRALNLNRRGILTGIATRDASAAVEELDKKYPQFKKVAEELYAYQDRIINYVYESGLIDGQMVIKMRELNKDYVPFFRVMDQMAKKGFMGKSFVNVSHGIKRIKGSETDIIDPLESIMKNTYSLISAADRNSVGVAMVQLAAMDKDLERLVEQVPSDMVKVASVNVSELFSDFEIKTMGEMGLDTEMLQRVVDIYRPSTFNKGNVATVMIGGQRRNYELDADLYKALGGLETEDLGTLIKILAMPARWLRAGATLSPEFLGRNPFRDQLTAFFYSKHGYKPFIDLGRGIFSLAKKDDLYWEWLRSGGAHSIMVGLDREYTRKRIQELTKAKLVLNPLEYLRAFSEFGETGTRLGEFRLARAQGKGPRESAFAAREITLDFSRIGAITKTLNATIAFWNAQVQGMDKMVREFRKDPKGLSLKALLAITVPTIALYAYNRKNKRYKELPQWQKDLFWVVPVGEKGPIIRIPKPFEMGIIFGTFPERVLQYIDTKDPAAFDRIWANLTQSVLPSAPLVGWTAYGPWIENITNYSFFKDRPIESRKQREVLPEARYNYYTPAAMRWLGRYTAKVGMSPLQLENLIQGYFGGLGTLAMTAPDLAMKTAGKAQMPLQAVDIPLIKGFLVRDPYGFSSASVGKFFDGYQDVLQKNETIMRYVKSGRGVDANRLRKKYPEWVLREPYEQASEALAAFRKRQDIIMQNEHLSPQKRLAMINRNNKQITELAQKLNDIFKRARAQRREDTFRELRDLLGEYQPE